jgi:hypothetical protein
MVIMSNELWDKIKENLCLDDRDGLATRINNDVYEISEEGKQHVMHLLLDDYNDCERYITYEESQKVQDRPHIKGLKDCKSIDNEVWIALNDCKEE